MVPAKGYSGLVARDSAGRAVASLPWGLVPSSEQEIRKAATKQVSSGSTLDEASRASWLDPLLKERYFTTPLATVVHAPPQRAAEMTEAERPISQMPAAKRQETAGAQPRAEGRPRAVEAGRRLRLLRSPRIYTRRRRVAKASATPAIPAGAAGRTAASSMPAAIASARARLLLAGGEGVCDECVPVSTGAPAEGESLRALAAWVTSGPSPMEGMRLG